MLGGEMMIMSAVDSTFFTLNPVATVIWQAADGRTPLSEIVEQQVCSEFEIDMETATRRRALRGRTLSSRHSAGFGLSVSGIIDQPDGGRLSLMQEMGQRLSIWACPFRPLRCHLPLQ